MQSITPEKHADDLSNFQRNISLVNCNKNVIDFLFFFGNVSTQEKDSH